MTSTIQNGEGVEARAREVLADRVRRLAPHKAAAIMAGASDDHVRVCTTIAAMIAFADESRQSLAREPATADVEREDIGKFYALPFVFHEPKNDNDAAYIRDANGQSVAMLMWPGHSQADTDAAVAETYAIGRTFAALSRAAPSSELPGNSGQLAQSSEPAIAEGEQFAENAKNLVDRVNAVFAENINEQSSRLNVEPVETESPGWWQQRVRKAAVLEALAQSSTPPASKGVEA